MKQKIIVGQKKVKKAIKKRKLVRLSAYFFYLGILATIFVIILSVLIKEGTVHYENSPNLSFTLDNCTLLISDHADAKISSPIYAKYRAPQELTVEQKHIHLGVNTKSDPQKISILNGLGERYCTLELFVKNTASLKSLKVDCPTCNIIQDTSFQLQITEALTITGGVISTNLRNVKVGSLAYKVTTGNLQLNNIETSSTSNTIEIDDGGDIAIQSVSDFTLDTTTNTQAFCYNGPSVTQVSNPNCAISGDSKFNLYPFVLNLF